MWRPHNSVPIANTNTREIQQLVRAARCYPPERETRIIQDIQDCCRHFSNLKPRLERCAIQPNKIRQLLILDGLIPIKYNGCKYHIPVAIWCSPGYPDEYPISYVRPTADMVLRTRHSHVDAQGKVYLPQMAWNSTPFNFYGVVLSMIRVFGTEPPVHTKVAISTPGQRPVSSNDSERRHLIASLTKQLGNRFVGVSEIALSDIGALLQRQDEAVQAEQSGSKESRECALQVRNAGEKLDMLVANKQALKKWKLDENEDDKQKQVDEVLQYQDSFDEQIMRCVVEDGAFGDVLDQLDEAFVKGVIDQDAYMKYVRHISRQQFFPRALKRQIEVAKSKQLEIDEHGAVRPMRSGPTTPLFAS